MGEAMTDTTRQFATDTATLIRRAREEGFILGLRLAVLEVRQRGHIECADDLVQVALDDAMVRSLAGRSFPELRALFAAGVAKAHTALNGKPKIELVASGGK